MAIEHEKEWGVVGRPLSLYAKCDLFQVVVKGDIKTYVSDQEV